MRGLAEELRPACRIEAVDSLDSIEESLAILGVTEEEWEPFFSETLLALRGLGGWSTRWNSAATAQFTRFPQEQLSRILGGEADPRSLCAWQLHREEAPQIIAVL